MEDIESDGDAGFSTEEEVQPLANEPAEVVERMQEDLGGIDPAYFGGHGQFEESQLQDEQNSDGSRTELERTPQPKGGSASPECVVISDTPVKSGEGAEATAEPLSVADRIKELKIQINFAKKQVNSGTPGRSFSTLLYRSG